MNATQPLPAYSSDALANLGPAELLDLLVGDEDRTPRNVIDECARRGEEMTEVLSELLRDDRCWQDDAAPGQWWLLLHAVMILGLVPTERAGLLLVQFMRRMAQEQDDNLQDWFAGDWPALFRNKPEAVLSELRALVKDRNFDWYIRAGAMDAVVAMAQHRGAAALDDTLSWAANLASDEQEDWDLRLSVGNLLLDFPRNQYRPLLEDLAQRQSGWNVHFGIDEIRDAYSPGKDQPEWERRDNPWVFYTPAAIERRQQRWAEEDAKELAGEEWEGGNDAFDNAPLPQPRETPKVGRNDPCPCGSGKKYKKCCLRGEDATVAAPEDFLHRRIRALIEDLPEQMLRFAGNRLGRGLIDEAWADFTSGEEEAFDPKSPHGPAFLSWFFYLWSLESARIENRELAAKTETVAAAFLAQRRRHLDPLVARYIESCGKALFSFHEVVRVEPGRGFALRDLMRERETFVMERSGSSNARPGDLMFAQIVTIDGLALIEGWGPVVFEPGDKPAIIALRKSIRGEHDAFSEALLDAHDTELIGLYLDLAERRLNPALPKLQNTDGDPLEHHTMVFGVSDPPAAAAALDAARLDGGEEIVRDDAGREGDDRLTEADWTWMRAGNAMHKSWDNTTLGRLVLVGGQLKVHVNSRARAERGKALVKSLLGDNAKYRVTEIASTEAMLAEARSRPPRKEDSEHERLAQLPEVRERITEVLKRHYTGWLDTRIPLLGDRTPRDAVRDRDGREAVAALITQMERDGANHSPPLDPEIPAMLRRELGLG